MPGQKALHLESKDDLPLVRRALLLEVGLPLLGQRRLRGEGNQLRDRRVLRLEGDQRQVFLMEVDRREAGRGTHPVRAASPAAPGPGARVLPAAHQRALLGAQGTLPTVRVRSATNGKGLTAQDPLTVVKLRRREDRRAPR